MQRQAPTPKILALTAVWCAASAMFADAGNYEAHFLYLGEDPAWLDEGTPWADDSCGLAHSDTHWFIMQPQRIWRIPVRTHLGTAGLDTPGVSVRDMNSVPRLWDGGFDYFGDPCAYQIAGTDYLLVPIYSGITQQWTLAAFRGDLALEFVALACTSFGGNWCAVDEGGRLFGPGGQRPYNSIVRYEVDWTALSEGRDFWIWYDRFNDDIIDLRDESSVILAPLEGFTGDITPSGGLLYLVALDAESGHFDIHVFELPGGIRTRVSTRDTGPFRFHLFRGWGEPGGMTIWDLEQTTSPHRGDLHVSWMDPERDENRVGVKHYTRTIHADPDSWADIGNGTIEAPYRTMEIALYFAWNGCEIRLHPGRFFESVILDKRILLTAQNGTAAIGQ